jgi:L-ascorbate metabolism protein UlaG (beta-lactamase superfamily)
MKLAPAVALLLLAATAAVCWLSAASPAVTGLIRQTNGDVLLTSAADVGAYYRIETSADLQSWQGFVTVQSVGADQLLDTGGPYQSRRFYRAVPLTGAGIFTGDHLQTANGDAILRAIGHASVAVSWNGKVLYSDPSGAASLFTGLPLADVVVITHTHSDHFSSTRLTAVLGTTGVIFAPQSVYAAMSATLKAKTTVLANGASATAAGMTILAVPMYNLSNSNHPQGVGNGYIITLGGKTIYFSGDTEDTPEMRALTNIDAAFVCMSLPSNMDVDKAASAVRAFRPRMVFPYHYSQGGITFDTALFKTLVGNDLGIEVRQRKFY